MELKDIIKQVESLGITLVFLENYQEKARLLEVKNEYFLFIRADLSEIEMLNVIYHELAHYKNGDLDSILSQIPTYNHRIEHLAETERIINVMSMINEEYPIDDSFNYVDYMQKALVPARYETLVKETATRLYQENLESNRI